jgi:hypothetical protein
MPWRAQPMRKTLVKQKQTGPFLHTGSRALIAAFAAGVAILWVVGMSRRPVMSPGARPSPSTLIGPVFLARHTPDDGWRDVMVSVRNQGRDPVRGEASMDGPASDVHVMATRLTIGLHARCACCLGELRWPLPHPVRVVIRWQQGSKHGAMTTLIPPGLADAR